MTGPESLQLPSVPCCPKMAETVLYWAAAAGSNYWLGCGKWGQMHCIIREPVDSGSPSQWLVINKIIGERWQRFLEFFLICMSFCTEFFMISFFICEGWVANDTVSCGVTRLCFWSQTDSVRLNEEMKQRFMACTCTLARSDICFCAEIQSHFLFTRAIYTAAHHIHMRLVNVQQAFLSITLSFKKALEGCSNIRVPSFSPWGRLSICVH